MCSLMVSFLHRFKASLEQLGQGEADVAADAGEQLPEASESYITQFDKMIPWYK